jgi:hypothetical protein
MSKKRLTPSDIERMRVRAESDLFEFALLVNPLYVYGNVHKRVFRWLQNGSGDLRQLLLLPRGHLKSHCMAVWCAWHITNFPETSILYISATSELAEKQLYDVKNMLTSENYRRMWPNMINQDEGKREKWSTTKIAVDHPARKRHGTRDWTVASAGLTTNTTGWHADVIVADDVVVPENAYTEDGRKTTSDKMSQMSSILNPGGVFKACGTRYYPTDLYDEWLNATETIFNTKGEPMDEASIYDVFEEVVEVDQSFIWPRSTMDGTRWYGFDLKTLARIKGTYSDQSHYFAQYYNDPNDPSSERNFNFQYFNREEIIHDGGQFTVGADRRPLNVYAAIDFAYSLSKTSDWTAIVVIGVDPNNHIYVLDIDRFKANKVLKYFEKVALMHSKWNFRRLRAEVTAAQSVIVNDLRDYITEANMQISVDEHRPTRNDGNKKERIDSALNHRYDNNSVWHYRGGFTPMLEEELILSRPRHDDIKDALASAVEIAVKPARAYTNDNFTLVTGGRFGGTKKVQRVRRI